MEDIVAIVTKGRYWARSKYNTKTGLRKGETRYCVGTNKTTDWKDSEIKPYKTKMGSNE